MDEAIRLLRAYWTDAEVSLESAAYPTVAMAMEPKPPQGARLPIWIGGNSEAAYRRVGRLGDGWLASRVTDAAGARQAIDAIRRHAEEAGRDPGAIGLQSMVAPPPRDAAGKTFYADHDAVVARVADLKAMGFGWVALNATAIFQAGARSVDAITEQLGRLHDRLRAEVG
jgi:alkanesulfonate monooxygenase SsuD/methylene tetrahydromethanopterin reductase-like flavin-dependent oxidoreductase (luciferase family)